MSGNLTRRFSLRTKLLLATAAVFVCLLAAMHAILYYSSQSQLLEAMRTYTTYVNRMIEVNARSALLQSSPERIQESLSSLAAEPGVVRVFIMDKKGVIRRSSRAKEVGTLIPLDDRTCQVCHAHQPVLHAPALIESEQTFRNVTPIYNEAACHACHQPEEKILGVLVSDYTFRDSPLVRALQRTEHRNFLILSLISLAGLLLIGAVIDRVIIRRILAAAQGTRLVAEGRLDQVLPAAGRDEISQLAGAFNTMTAHLKQTMQDLQHSRAYLSDIINSVEEEIFVVDRDSRIREANAAFLKRAGLTREQALGRSCHELTVHAEEECPDDCPVNLILETGRPVETVHSHLVDGKVRQFQISATPLRREDGSIFEVVVVTWDITHRVELEAQVRHSEKLATVGQLATSFAHELKNPIAGINATMQILEEDFPAEDRRREIFNEIYHQISRMNKAVDDLLRYAKPAPPQLSPTRISREIERAMLLLHPQARKQKVEIVSEVSDNLPELMVDSELIQQVLMNVSINALQAMPAGGRLSIAARFERNNGLEGVAVRIEDTGKGIAPANLGHIFEPFFTTKHTGTGLGLSICSKIMDQHGGTIQVETKEGKGTAFTLFFPHPSLA
jgi:PAS domain S-box-containing protein